LSNDKPNTKEKSSSDAYTDISKIEEMVDKIILKNKEKVDKLRSEQIDVERFSIKNKKGDTLYYLRKKSDKKSDDKDTDILSEEIISEARENLGEEPLEEKTDEQALTPDKKADKKQKIRIRFGKKDKKTDDEEIATPPTTDDLIESKDFNKVVSEIDDALDNTKSEPVDKDAKLVDEKITEMPETDKPDEEKDLVAEKANELAKKHDFFEKDKADWLSKSTDDLAELKKKYEKNITISDFEPSEKDKVDEEESEILDKKITEAPITEESDGKEIEKGEDLVTSKAKKSFFKKAKPPEDKAVDLKQEETDAKPEYTESLKVAVDIKDAEKKEPEIIGEGIGASKAKKSFFKKKTPSDDKTLDLEKKEIKPVKPQVKPAFHVANMPKNEELAQEEKELLDNKIKESPGLADFVEDGNKGESEALKLAEKHLKDKPKPASDKKPSAEKEVKNDIDIPRGVPLAEENSEHEHVFFDEEDSHSGGWAPQITDKTKKAMALPISGQGEIDSDNLKSLGDIELPKEVLQTKSVKLSDLGFSDKEWEELDFYPLHEPFSYVEILREKESLDKCYFLVEIALTEEEEKLLGFIEDTMRNLEIDTKEFEEKSEEEYLLERLNQVCEEYNIDLDEESKHKIFYYIGKSSLGLGKIDPLMKDPNIEDISCDGSDVPVFLYHRTYGSLKSNVRFADEDELSSFVFRLAQKCGKHISIAEPMLDATMPDGSRIQMTLSDEITAKGSTFTIRKFRADPFSPPDLVEFNTMSAEMIAYMWIAVENGINTLFAGGTASGKTTALNALTLFIPRESKIVSIEETREINLPHPNWIPGVARSGFGEIVADKVVGEIDMYDLMKAALRQRPEYILVGEIRGREAYVLFQAMATGHATYSTAHADSAQSLIHRLEGKPINIPRVMLQSLDIVCLHVITRVKNIRARRCKQIIEVIDIDPTTKEILTNEVFRWDPVEDTFIYSGKSYILERVRAEKDLSREEMTSELRNRKEIVEWMNQNNIRAFKDVAQIVAQYTESPDETLKMIKKGEKNKCIRR